jgi:mRNA interferase MazF
VYRVALDPTVGAEKRKTRPCVIVRRDMIDASGERRNPMTIVVPLNDAHDRVENVLNILVPSGVGGTTKPSLVVCSQLRAVDKRRFVGERMGRLPQDVMVRVDRGRRVVLALD